MGYGAGMTYGRSWLLSKRWNMEVEAGLGLLVAPYTKYRCEHCGDKVKSGTYFYRLLNWHLILFIYSEVDFLFDPRVYEEY